MPRNSLDYDRKIDLHLGTDVIMVEPRNFEELMVKSLGLDWNEDTLNRGENAKEIRSQNHKRQSEKNIKREIKDEGGGRKSSVIRQRSRMTQPLFLQMMTTKIMMCVGIWVMTALLKSRRGKM